MRRIFPHLSVAEIRWLLIAAVLMSVMVLPAACSGGDNSAPIPRRKAYPRIEIPDSAYRSEPGLPYSLQINDSAIGNLTKSDGRNDWVDVEYPAHNAVIYYTFSTVDPSQLESAIDNRSERIALNLGGREAEILSFATPYSLDCEVIVDNQGAGATPVQFIATDHRCFVVSGAAHIKGDKMSIDSISPVVDMLRRDVVHSLKTLRP